MIRKALATVVGGAIAVTPLLGMSDASAATATCRFASSTNTIYISSGAVTLSDIMKLCKNPPLIKGDNGVWQLNADLVLQDNAKLSLHGTRRGGDVNELRLRSGSSGRRHDVAQITAQYGRLDLNGVKVTSWDPAKNSPDTTTAIPSGGERGRAFMRAVSYMDGNTPRESRFDIRDSDIGYLGYSAAESYGVALKARGCGADTPSVCRVLDVTGQHTNSRFHHNYMGTYTWGAQDMEFRGNQYDNNVSYGLDPHDDSDYLTITDNEFNHNGNHGLICSKRCDHLTITNNESHDNGRSSGSAVHGIMLHAGISDTVVKNNKIWNQRSGAGISVFDSVGNEVSGNDIRNSRYGLRFSVGTRDLKVLNNRVTDSTLHALYTYSGSDSPEYTGDNPRPRNITISGNTFSGAGSDVLRITDSDSFVFSGNTINGSRTASFESSSGQVYERSNKHSGGMTFKLKGSPSAKTSVTFRGWTASQLKVSKDSNSTATFTG